MNQLPPSFARLRLSRRTNADFGLWIPLFLLWPLWFFTLALFYLLLVCITVATSSHAFRAAFAATEALHRVACSLRGTRCDVSSERGRVSVAIV
ncbi:MAG: hypothetical protein RL701_2223 [Pseudomonadota bacterium]|jgi:hypothetical protein